VEVETLLLNETSRLPPPARRPLAIEQTTTESGFGRRDDALAFPSEERRDPGQCLLDSPLATTAEFDEFGASLPDRRVARPRLLGCARDRRASPLLDRIARVIAAITPLR
jgi:hypothetical protein